MFNQELQRAYVRVKVECVRGKCIYIYVCQPFYLIDPRRRPWWYVSKRFHRTLITIHSRPASSLQSQEKETCKKICLKWEKAKHAASLEHGEFLWARYGESCNGRIFLPETYGR
jgi:hypothetical protein